MKNSKHEIDFSKLIDSEHEQKGTLFLDLADNEENSINICRELLKVVNKDSETFKCLEMFIEQSLAFGLMFQASVMCDTTKKQSIN